MRWKVLPHRLSDGRCRDCGTYSAYSAPQSCCRCGLERFADDGCTVQPNPVAAFQAGYELWRTVAIDLTSGKLKSGSFYPYIGHNDGAPLEPPMGDLDPADWQVDLASLAHELGLALALRYPQVWVVTTVGCWNPRMAAPAA
jgi:hypothetical protein